MKKIILVEEFGADPENGISGKELRKEIRTLREWLKKAY